MQTKIETHTARKGHDCCLCTFGIQSGEKYSRWRWFGDGDAVTVKVHPGCLAILMDLCRHDDEEFPRPDELFTTVYDLIDEGALTRDALIQCAPDVGARWWASISSWDIRERDDGGWVLYTEQPKGHHGHARMLADERLAEISGFCGSPRIDPIHLDEIKERLTFHGFSEGGRMRQGWMRVRDGDNAFWAFLVDDVHRTSIVRAPHGHEAFRHSDGERWALDVGGCPFDSLAALKLCGEWLAMNEATLAVVMCLASTSAP